MELRLLVWLGASPSAIPWLAIALTYLSHSLVWAVTVALLVRVRTLSSATRHLYWKAALLGPLLSALLAIAVEGAFSQGASRWYVRDFIVPGLLSARSRLEAAPGQVETILGAGDAAPGPSLLSNPTGLVLALVAFAVALGLVRFCGSAFLLWQRLGDRTPVLDARLRQRFEELQARMGLHRVTLTESSAVGSPLVLGRREVCLPRGLLKDLPATGLDSVFLHELSHIERADGIWFPVIGAVQAALWFHPLNHWLASRFRDSAELACDDRAVELTRDPLGLARALVQVASGGSFGMSAVPTMVRSQGALLKRVERLTRDGAASPRGGRHSGRAQALAFLTALVMGLGMLSVQVAQAQSEASPAMALSAPALYAVPDAGAPPNDAEHRARMSELASRERSISAQLAAAERASTASGEPESARVLELSQQLRHVRGTQAWLEEQFVRELSAWEERARPAPAR